MRIRQIRPEFFTDPVTAHLPAAVQVTYVGLWCYADDSGWLAWDVDQIGALLYPYKSIRVRTGLVKSAGDALADIKRLVFFDCGCAWIPTLAIHQKIGGNKSHTARDKHAVHTSTDKSGRPKRVSRPGLAPESIEIQEVHTSTDLYPVTVSEGSNGNADARAREGGAASDFRDKLVAAGIDPTLVKSP